MARRNFAQRNPRLVAGAVCGSVSGFSFDHWVWDLGDRGLLIWVAVVGLLIWAGPPAYRLYLDWTRRRYGQVYRYWLYWHQDMHLPPDQRRFDYDGYVGQSRYRTDRHLQHLGISKRWPGPPSPWSDLIANPAGPDGHRWPELLYESERYTDTRLDGLEEGWIRRHGTVYNHEYNLACPFRVPVPQARRERAQRDAARLGATRWVG